jgi:hypothetical protein
MFLTLAALLLLLVIIAQNVLYPPLRQETVSDGLYGPYHWFLDGAYVVLATALIFAFEGKGIGETLSLVASGALMVTAITNTFSTWVDKIKVGLHTKLHSWFSVGMFVSMLGLEYTQNHSWLWYLSGAGLVLPIVTFGLCQIKSLKVAAGPAAEKVAILFLCLWMIAWSNFR